jgi:hypothetical protein
MRLAMRFGRPDVDRFMRGLTSRQLAEWEQFLVLESQPDLKLVSEKEFRSNYAKRVVKKPRR